MRKLFYPKIALTNIKKNGKIYFPYILTSICTIIMFYIMHSISRNDGLNQMPGSESLKSMLGFGNYVIGIFSAIFLFYTNSFLIKSRKKELGLYNILGLDKKHIAKMMIWETLIVSIPSLIIGSGSGVLLSKLIFLLLLKILNFGVPLNFSISMSSLSITAMVFTGIFFLTLLTNLWQIQLANPIQLLRGGQLGEKEPKTKWFLTLVGILALGSGYIIALSVESPLQALSLFFIAVVLVMVGTYELFTAGSIAILKMLRKNKHFYYQTKHFTSVSGMIYRMKQNAVGLANICILSTVVLVILSTTVCLYIGQEDLLRTRFPQDISIEYNDGSDEKMEAIKQVIEEEAKNYEVSISDFISFEYMFSTAKKDMNNFIFNSPSSYHASSLYAFCFLTVDEYNQLENQNMSLEEDEVLIYSIGKNYGEAALNIGNRQFKVKDELSSFIVEGKQINTIADGYYVIVKDVDLIRSIFTEQGIEANQKSSIRFNVNGNEKSILEFASLLNQNIRNEYSITLFDSLHLSKESFYAVYGGLLFLGIFLGLLFLMATVLIIYYKQISEGYEDKDRFEIMQQVGMSKKEIKQSIQSQIKMIFFLPLVTAIIHITFAFKVMTKLLALLNLSNITLFLWCTIVTILIFGMIYGIVYSLTAKAYYKIVR